MIADVKAERAVLGAILLRPDVLNDVVHLVAEDDFSDPKHAAVFRAIAKVANRGDTIDIVTLERELEVAERLRMVGGGAALSELAGDAVGARAVVRHARQVRDLGVARRLYVAAMDVRDAASEAVADPVAWVERQAARLADAAKLHREDTAQRVGALLPGAMQRLQRRAAGEELGTPYGYPDLDVITGGMVPTEYVVLAARPSCGKSALAMQIAWQVAVRERVPVRVHSLEMNDAQQVDRLFAQIGRVNHGSLRTGRLTAMDMENILGAAKRLHEAPLWLDQTRGLTIGELSSRVRQWRRDPQAGGAHERALVVVDYLQLVRPSRRSSSREQEVAEVSGALQTLAGQTGCSLVVLAQLSREVEKRGKSAKPMLSDLRESGAIEQDADTILFVHRPDRSDESVSPGTSELIVAKARNGETGAVPLHFVGRLVSFESVERRRQEHRG
ncbi:MAG TPA: replicative DNA helicase [Candidatus Limnocylindria bacterium]|nr:replicative DNA helicase [Candidatus Limnocylindria bacterium]